MPLCFFGQQFQDRKGGKAYCVPLYAIEDAALGQNDFFAQEVNGVEVSCNLLF